VFSFLVIYSKSGRSALLSLLISLLLSVSLVLTSVSSCLYSVLKQLLMSNLLLLEEEEGLGISCWRRCIAMGSTEGNDGDDT
jgi:hypothetical protein